MRRESHQSLVQPTRSSTERPDVRAMRGVTDQRTRLVSIYFADGICRPVQSFHFVSRHVSHPARQNRRTDRRRFSVLRNPAIHSNEL